MDADIVNAIGMVTPVLSTLTSLALLGLGWILRKHEKDIQKLKKAKSRHGRSIYGDELDPQQTGIAQDIHDLSDRVDRLDEKVSSLDEKIDEIRQHTRDLNGYHDDE